MDNFVIFSLALAGILNSISIVKINNKIIELKEIIGFLSRFCVDEDLKDDYRKYLKEKIEESK